MFHLGRKVEHIGPTLIGTYDMARDHELYGDDPKKYGYSNPVIPEGDWLFCLPFGDDGDGTPTIAVNEPWLTKALLEQAIGWYIRQRYGCTAPFRYRWRANKRYCVTPV